MTYSGLILWIEKHFPLADYDLTVTIGRRSSSGGDRRARWEAYVWPLHRTIHVEGHTPLQIQQGLEANLKPTRLAALSAIDVDLVGVGKTLFPPLSRAGGSELTLHEPPAPSSRRKRSGSG